MSNDDLRIAEEWLHDRRVSREHLTELALLIRDVRVGTLMAAAVACRRVYDAHPPELYPHARDIADKCERAVLRLDE